MIQPDSFWSLAKEPSAGGSGPATDSQGKNAMRTTQQRNQIVQSLDPASEEVSVKHPN